MVINNKNSTIVVVLKIISNLPSNDVKNNTKRSKKISSSSEKSIGKRIVLACYPSCCFVGSTNEKYGKPFPCLSLPHVQFSHDDVHQNT